MCCTKVGNTAANPKTTRSPEPEKNPPGNRLSGAVLEGGGDLSLARGLARAGTTRRRVGLTSLD